MKILLTNDDGIYAEGLWAVQKALSQEHDVFVVAPDKERSAVGHSITLMHPLIIDKIHTNGGWGYAVSGTPADCVKLAVGEILDAPPDMVVSGINPGPNVGINVHYSGTVSAAKEAALMGLKAIAVSQGLGGPCGFAHTAAFVASLVRRIMDKGLPRATFLNVNVPSCPREQIRAIRITRQAIVPFREKFHKRTDPRNRTYYWQGTETQVPDDAPDTDSAVLRGNCISITPIRCDMTDYDTMQQLGRWDLKL